MSNAALVLGRMKQSRNWTEDETQVLVGLGNDIATVESLRDAQAVQKSDKTSTGFGPGRGLYQFEVQGSGGSGSSKVAVNRFNKFITDNELTERLLLTPTEQAELAGEDPDFSKLSGDVQTAIFYANASEHPDTRMDDIVRGKVSAQDYWINFHWAGKTGSEAKRIQWDRAISHSRRRQGGP